MQNFKCGTRLLMAFIPMPMSCCLNISKSDSDSSKATFPTAKPLPGEWTKRIDPATKAAYWTNSRTGVSQWDSLNYNPPIVPDHWDDNWDGHPINEHGAVHQIVLVRHGQYVHGKGDENRFLTSLGREQAESTGKRLRELVDSNKIYPIDTVYYSTKTRAVETHSIIQKYFPELPVHKIQACSMIREGRAFETIPRFESSGWIHPNFEDPDPKWAAEGSRIEAGFRNHVYRAPSDKEKSYSTILVCHGNVIRYFVCRALQLPPTSWSRFSIHNSSIVIIDIYPNGKASLRLGDAGHLPPNRLTHN